MIVNQLTNSWEVIFHRAHALLAGRIAFNWHFDHEPEWLWETIAAIMQHDDHVVEIENPHLTEMGHPEDFRMRERHCNQVCERHIATALHRGRWVALMTSMHMCFLLAEMAKTNPEVQSFINLQKKKQNEWLEGLPFTQEEADHAYLFLRFCDRLSLILTCRQVPEKGRRLEVVSKGEHTYFLRLVEGDALTISPWPFRDNELILEAEYRVLTKPGYDSPDRLRDDLACADVKIHRWKLVRV